MWMSLYYKHYLIYCEKNNNETKIVINCISTIIYHYCR